MAKEKHCLVGTVFDKKLGKCVIPAVFRTWDNGSTVALFPTNKTGSQNHVASFTNFGKHDDADYKHIISTTRPATQKETKKMLRELQKVGYGNIRVNKKRDHRWKSKDSF